MKKEHISLYKLLSNSVMKIVILGILSVLIVLSIFNYFNIRNIEKTLKSNIDGLIKIAFNSMYNTLYDFDERFYKSLDKLMLDLKERPVDDYELIKIFSSMSVMMGETYDTKMIDINNLDQEVRNKIINLNDYSYYVIVDMHPKMITRYIYIKTENDYFLIESMLPTNRIIKTINNLTTLKDTYEFITDINICTHDFESLASSYELNELDTTNLMKVFANGEPIVLEKNGKFTYYSTWKYEDEKTYFHPIGIILKMDFGVYRNSIIYNILVMFVALLFIIYIISKKVHMLSKQISTPFEKMIDNMKNFQKTRYLEFDKIFDHCNIKEINELMTEYQKMTEDIVSSFEEINTMNEELEESYREIESINNELEEAYINFSTQLAMISEGYDENTGNHVNRVGELSAFIAEKLGVMDENIEKIRHYAPLHDIGKIMVPKEILTKKGRLTKEEFEIMKKHTLYGATLIGDSPQFEIAKNIALYHHEKYNGKGYPFGLKGEDIPLCATIVSVVDVYDALRSERPYKPAFTHEKAMDIILNGDDRTNPDDFNPEVLKIIKEYEYEIKELWEKIKEDSSKLKKILDIEKE